MLTGELAVLLLFLFTIFRLRRTFTTVAASMGRGGGKRGGKGGGGRSRGGGGYPTWTEVLSTILYPTYTEVPSTNFILTLHPDSMHCTCEPQERMFRSVRLVDRDFNRYVSPIDQSRAESLHTASIPRGGDVMYYSDGSDIQVTWPLGTTLSVCGDQIEEVEIEEVE